MKGGIYLDRVKGFSIIAIVLLIFQVFSINFGMNVVSEAANDQDELKLEIKSKNVSDNTITWEISVDALDEEETNVITDVRFSSGQSPKEIEHKEEVKAKTTEKGYEIETSADGDKHVVKVMTEITDQDVESFQIRAESKFNGTTVSEEEEVKIERVQNKSTEVEDSEEKDPPSKETENKKTKEQDKREQKDITNKKEDREQKDNTKEEEPQVNEEEDDQVEDEEANKEESKGEDGKTDKEDAKEESKSEEEGSEENSDAASVEDGYVPVEQYGKQSSSKAVPFSTSNIEKLSGTDEPTATHKIETPTSDNICIREVEGEIDINLPAPEERTPVDIVVVQDASGSYEGNANQAKQSLRDIVDMLDLSEDRMMVTSYRGYKGWKSYNSVGDFDAGNVRSTGSRGRSEQGLTLTDHTGLSNNESALKNGINQITFDGATPTASGLQYAKEQYEAATSGQDLSNRNTVFILITDGVANAMLDGDIHIQYNGGGIFNPHSWQERYQFHERTFSEVLGVASSIKSKGYTMVSAYWENKRVLQNSYGTDNYNNVIGPAARDMVRNAASSPDLYNDNEDLAEAMADLLENLQSVLDEYNGFKTEFDIAPGFELVPDSILLNGDEVDYTISGNTVTITANKIKSGESTITYKLKETTVHGETTTPITNGTIYYDKSNGSFKTSIAIPEALLAGNENSESCQTDITKSVAKDQSNEFVDRISLDEMNESFTYKLEYQFGEDVGEANTVQLKDQLETVLELVGDANSIEINTNITNLSYDTTLLNNEKGFIIDLHKQNSSFDYLAGKKITVTFQAKIKDNVTSEDLTNYRELGIPNEAMLLIDDEREPSNEVYVDPPKFGTIKIIKVDAKDDEVPLANAEFNVIDNEGIVVDTLTTDDNGIATSKELLAGDYTLVEVKAPVGYELLDNDVTVTVEAGTEQTKKIKNERLKGSITVYKVDDENEALAEAEFTLVGPNGYEEVKASDAEGKITFEQLEWGTYTLKETQAPEGYRLLRKEITLEISGEDLTIEQTVENSKAGWDIPETGGVGSLGFFGAGFLLMVGAGWFIFRRRHME